MFINEKKEARRFRQLIYDHDGGYYFWVPELGIVFFYDFHGYFIEDPLSILRIWEGGLASHGALIGILIALFLFVKKHSDYKKLFPIQKIINPQYTYLWILDRIVVPVALAGGFIRTGNFFNSEIVGKYTEGFFWSSF
jgi:phosphatidylglycerol:prolipoprotein diacylglycerol transferase